MNPNDHDYISDVDIVPPSPELNRPHDFSPVYDISSPPFVDQTGSYNNSPFSNHSELSFHTAEGDLSGSFFGDDNSTHGLFDPIGSAGLQSDTDYDGYDPATYDAPHSASSLLMFTDSNYAFHSISSPDHHSHHNYHRASSVPFDHSSPASSNGSVHGQRSRASSVSSSYQGQQQQQQQQSQFTHSPRLDVAHSFENMSVRSPNWHTDALPQGQKQTHSPPRLMMPDGTLDLPIINAPDGDGMGGPQLHIVPATPIGATTDGTGAPYSNSGNSQTRWGSQAPSAPGSAGPSSRQPSPFRFPQSSATNASYHPYDPSSSSSAHHQHQRQSSQHQHSQSTTPVFGSPNPAHDSYLYAPHVTRGRSKSDNALEMPVWDQAYIQQQGLGGRGDTSALALDLDSDADSKRTTLDGALNTGSSTSSMGIDSSAPNSASSAMSGVVDGHHSHHGSPSFMMQNFAFGSNNGEGSRNGVGGGEDSGSSIPHERNGLLVADHGGGFGMRRAKSEGGGPRIGHRQSRSEDLRGAGIGAGYAPQVQPAVHLGGLGIQGIHDGAGLQQQHQQHQQQQQNAYQQQFLQQNTPPTTYGHSHSLSLGGGGLYPPPNDFLTPNSGGNNSGHMPILPPIRSLSPGGRGHIRRASSGSRSERGVSASAENWLTPSYSGSGQGHSARASPYPSPNASPRVRYDELELDLEREATLEVPAAVNSAGFEHDVSLRAAARLGLSTAPTNAAAMEQKTLDVASFLNQAGLPINMGGSNMGGVDGVVPVPVNMVSKPNVTTMRTATASHKRRKQEASFVCPFPGCGSTFTRSFNLKGHIRSHNEEKPFMCKWPGCGKGFARQHDCKRHEQLHTNYRPFNCEGCSRQFARMDALNRHLRSEGGAECAKSQSAQDGSSNANSSQRGTPGESVSPSPPPGRTNGVSV